MSDSEWFYIPGDSPHQREYVNLDKLKEMIRVEEGKENYERCAELLKILKNRRSNK